MIPVCALSSLTFLMMYSAYKLNKQGDRVSTPRSAVPGKRVTDTPQLSWMVARGFPTVQNNLGLSLRTSQGATQPLHVWDLR